ncbi:hypothetical protein [Herbaspirillum lusitanum]|uniref:hypothetical protein n=1 Tax=Herbaspirillum lusitanum TaxID=213312 RepID=UPI000A2F5E80|nr:hypothetical protein [Herbaspirillum lusitanum]
MAIISTAKLYEVQKYCSMTNHMWDGFWFLANKKSFERLPKDLQEIVTRNVNEAGIKQRADVKALNDSLATEPGAFSALQMGELSGMLLDRLDIEVVDHHPDPSLLSANHDEATVEETLLSHLLKSNCPVTGQPDWGSVQIHYVGAPINQEALLKYLIGFREHNEFHEQCVERIFVDVLRQCRPQKLAVYARYTRRGGLDINPWRSNFSAARAPSNLRNARQ